MSTTTTEAQGFVRVSCMTADVIRAAEIVKPTSSLTDLTGEFGEPQIFTEWSIERTDGSFSVVLRENRWPRDPDRDCEHWTPAPGFNWTKYHGREVAS